MNQTISKGPGAFMSFLLVILGGAILLSPRLNFLFSLSYEILFAILLIASAIALLFHFIQEIHPRWYFWFIPIVMLLLGGWLLMHPVAGAMIMVWALAIVAFVSGVFSMIDGIRIQGRLGLFLVLSGWLSLAIASFIWLYWPVSGLTLIGALFGTQIMFFGLYHLYYGRAAV